jgi:hypothetical protein
MKGNNTPNISANQKLYRSEFDRPGRDALVHVAVEALYDRWRGTYAIQAEVPDAQKLVFPDDLGTLMQCFGWALAGLNQEMRMDQGLRPDHRIWGGCCETIWQVEYCLRLDVPRDDD